MTKRKKQYQPETVPSKSDPAKVLTAEFPFQILQTESYRVWIISVANPTTRARITQNVNKMRRGLFGDWKEIGTGVFEMRIDFGPGYRAYYTKRGNTVIVLLGGGEKSSQRKDIADAERLWEELCNEATEV